MSWSVTASGKIATVQTELARQFAWPLADGPAGLPDESEKETVRQVAGMIDQCLGTFDPENTVTVSAHGYIGFAEWATRTGAYQIVGLSIQPMA